MPAVERLRVRYPDRPRDVEALFVDGQGDHAPHQQGPDGRLRPLPNPGILLGQAIGRRGVARDLADRAPGRVGRLVTDAALSPDGRRVAVRTYQEIYLFDLTGDGAIRPEGVACSLGGLELQGEGVAWLDGSTLVLTSEGLLGVPGTVSVGRCPPADPQTLGGRKLASPTPIGEARDTAGPRP